jgi:hypothetical protein
MRVRFVTSVIALALAASACTGADDAARVSVNRQAALVPASKALLAQCQKTADAVGYAVSCPTRVPLGLEPTAVVAGCRLGIIGPGGAGRCAHSWRGWVVGSSETGDQHLVLVASPHALADPARVVNGPAWYPGARVRTLSRVTINGRRMRVVYVSPDTNEGSAFAHHVVLIWTMDDHTYGIGFHDVAGIPATLALDVALARGIRLVPPSP